MRTKYFFTIIALLMTVGLTAHAKTAYKRETLNIKLPSQSVLDKTTVVNAVALDADLVLEDHAGATAADAVTVTSFTAQPDVARNITVTPTGTTADVAAGDVVVTGTNIMGATISETFTFLANASTAVVGAKAFKTVTSIVFPAEDSPFGATWDVGVGNKIGLGHCLAGTGYTVLGLVDGAALTSYTVTASASAIESNGFTPNPVANAARDFEVHYIQNYRCP